MFTLNYSSRGKSDLKIAKKLPQYEKLVKLIKIVQQNPFQTPPPYEKLLGLPRYSRKIDYVNRLVYSVDIIANNITIVSCLTHYHD